MLSKLPVIMCLCGVEFGAEPSSAHRDVMRLVDAHAAEYRATSRKIWELAEVGYQEQKSSALLQRQLKVARDAMTVLQGIWARILKCAQGGAMGTETTVKWAS